MAATPQNTRQKPASITLLNPYILSPSSPRANAQAFSPLPPPPRLDSLNREARPISVTPSEMSVTQLPTTTDATADDAMLARLDFTNDALTLNLGALTRFGNPFLVDVAASALLAVAVAEAARGRRSRKASNDSFEPPPPSYALGPKPESDTKAFREAFQEGFNKWGGNVKPPGSANGQNPLTGLRKWSMKSSQTSASSKTSGSLDKDIELGEWYGQSNVVSKKEAKRAEKKAKEEDGLPFVARTIITVLTFAFKAAVFVLKIAIKVVAGVVVMITRNFSKL